MAVYRIVADERARRSSAIDPWVVVWDNDGEALLTGTLTGALDWLSDLFELPITITCGEDA